MPDTAPHYVIIGNGPAGDQAAHELRRRDPDGRITLITAGRLLFIRRFDLYRVDLAAIAGTGATAEAGETILEDVFIRLMGESTDNMGTKEPVP